jgi:mono/diheme cytochrome c family protein
MMGAACLTNSPVRADDGQPPPTERAETAAAKIDFVKDVQPLFRTRCFSCHGPEESESGLRMDQKKRALEGGDNGRIVVPEKPAESRLLRIVTGQDD